MKIIRRKRTITIETCAFRRWQNEGTEGNFSCPNCGKTFQSDTQLTAATSESAGLLTSAIEEEAQIGSHEPERNDRDGSCDPEGHCGSKVCNKGDTPRVHGQGD